MLILCKETDLNLRNRSYNYGPLKELAVLFYWNLLNIKLKTL